MIAITVLLACTIFGLMVWIVRGDIVPVLVTPGKFVAVGDAVGVKVAVVMGVGELGVLVAVSGVGEPVTAVRVGSGVKVATVAVGRGVSDGMAVGVGVGNIGAPNSLHPRSTDPPPNPAIGLGGTSSPLLAIN